MRKYKSENLALGFAIIAGLIGLVNGRENKELEKYLMKDGDEIIIEFKSHSP